MKWETVQIKDICKKVTSGGTPLTTKDDYYFPPQIPWIKTKEVNFCRITEAETYISREGLENSSAKLIPENSVIIAMYGQGDTAGRIAINKIPVATNQACCNLIINESKADYRFVYYKLSTMYKKLVSLKNGGAQPNLSATIIKSLEISIPSLTMQYSIADILSAYDDLIENNQKQIKLLEEAAQRLYKEWFVDLRFPGHENVKIVDGVPEGWKQCTLGEMASILRRGISPKYDDGGKYLVISQKCIRRSIMDTGEARRESKEYAPELNLQDADTVICSTGTGTLGRVGQVCGTYPDTTFDSHVTLVRTKNYQNFFYQAIKGQQEFLMGMGRGSTNQQELYRNVIENLQILVPTQEILNKTEKMLFSMHHKVTDLNSQILLLIEARDRLLPKLLSGELEA